MKTGKLISKVLRTIFYRLRLPAVSDYFSSRPSIYIDASSDVVERFIGTIRDSYSGEAVREELLGLARAVLKEQRLHYFQKFKPLDNKVFQESEGFSDGSAGKHWTATRLDNFKYENDFKFIWEINRLESLDILIGAYCVDRNVKWLDAAERIVAEWQRQNPVFRGINWFSNMEIAIREFRFAMLMLVGRGTPIKSPHCMRAMADHAARLPRFVESTRRTMGGNHFLIELAALSVIECCKGNDDQWFQRLMLEVDRQFLGDGGNFENSMGYHVYCADALLMVLLFKKAFGTSSAQLEEKLRPIMEFTKAFQDSRGWLPAIGDWDDGRVFRPLREHPRDATYQLALARQLLEGFDEQPVANGESWHIARAFGAACANSGDVKLVFRSGTIAAGHGHLDMLQLTASDSVSDWIIDGGTGYYNYSPEVRQYFRSPQAHSTLLSENCEMPLKPFRTFAWRGSLKAEIALSSEMQVKGSYVHPSAGAMSRDVSLANDGVFLRDRWGAGDATQRFIVPRGIELESLDESEAIFKRLADGRRMTISLESRIEADLAATACDYSPAYGEIEQGTCLDIRIASPPTEDGVKIKFTWD